MPCRAGGEGHGWRPELALLARLGALPIAVLPVGKAGCWPWERSVTWAGAQLCHAGRPLCFVITQKQMCGYRWFLRLAEHSVERGVEHAAPRARGVCSGRGAARGQHGQAAGRFGERGSVRAERAGGGSLR